MYSVMWSEHCSYKSSKVHLRYFGETTTDGDARADARRDRGERRCGRHRRRLGGHVQGRVAQPPVLRGALPGRGDRGRRDRARHHGDGRPAGRGGRPAAVRPGRRPGHPRGCCPGWSPGSAATATASACPTSAARSCSTRATRATRWSTRCAWVRCGPRTCTWRSPPAPATRSSCSARGPGWTASAGCRCWPARPSPATRPAAGRKKLPSVQVGDPFTEKVLIECCLELFRGRAGGRHPGPRRRRAVLRDQRAGQRRRRRHARRAGRGAAARRRDDAGGDPVQRVAGADVRGGAPGRCGRVPGGLPRSGTCSPR